MANLTAVMAWCNGRGEEAIGIDYFSISHFPPSRYFQLGTAVISL
jgi:hypothetical protein